MKFSCLSYSLSKIVFEDVFLYEVDMAVSARKLVAASHVEKCKDNEIKAR